MNIWVQFSDATQLRITSVFWSPQDPTDWPDLVELQDDDPRYLAFINPQPTQEEILAAKEAKRQLLMNSASIAMTPVFLALQLGDATDDETLSAKAWRAYYVALQAVDISVDNPEWPVSPQ